MVEFLCQLPQNYPLIAFYTQFITRESLNEDENFRLSWRSSNWSWWMARNSTLGDSQHIPGGFYFYSWYFQSLQTSFLLLSEIRYYIAHPCLEPLPSGWLWQLNFGCRKHPCPGSLLAVHPSPSLLGSSPSQPVLHPPAHPTLSSAAPPESLSSKTEKG